MTRTPVTHLRPASSRRRPHGVLALCAALCALLLIAGCGGGLSKKETHKPSLASVIAAAYASPQDGDFGAHDHLHGWVVLIHADGSYDTVRTSGMDTAALLWNSGGLHFTDRSRDYTLSGSRLTTVASTKDWHGYANGDIQIGLLPGRTPTSTVGVYNFGALRGAGYLTEVVTTTRGRATQRMLTGDYEEIGSCGGRVYGVTDGGMNLSAAAKHQMPESVRSVPRQQRYAGPAHQLAYLADISGTRPRFIASHDGAAPGSTSGSAAPCTHGILTFLMGIDHGTKGPAPRYTAELWRWNTRTGSLATHPLVTSAHRVLDDSRDDVGAAFFNQSSIAGGTLTWVGGTTGAVYETDLATGVTRTRFATGCRNKGLAEFSATMTTSSIALLCTDSNANARTPMRLKRFSRATGKPAAVVTVKGLNAAIRGNLVLRGIAVPPRS
ncbi:MAG TPA: hypothetical protein VF426_06470 [Marmoricola sp.]